MTRNCSDWRAAVNSRFSSNRTNKRFLLQVSCGRRKTRLCTVEDGGFPQHERSCTKVSVSVWLFRLHDRQKITRLIARLPACLWTRQSPFSDDCLLYFVVIFLGTPMTSPVEDGSQSSAFLLVSFRFAEAWTSRSASIRYTLKIPMGVHIVLIGNRGNYTG